MLPVTEKGKWRRFVVGTFVIATTLKLTLTSFNVQLYLTRYRLECPNSVLWIYHIIMDFFFFKGVNVKAQSDQT